MRIFLTLCAAVLVVLSAQAEPARVAVWNPEKPQKNPRLKIDPALAQEVAGALEAGGVAARLVTTDELNAAETFSSAKFDALVLEGDFFPRPALEAIKRFADDGGVVVLLSAMVPMLVQADRDAEGLWSPEPAAPNFAWEKRDVMEFFGAHYSFDPAKHNLGIEHTPTTLLLKYLPGMKPLQTTLPSRWITPAKGAEFYALMRGRRADYQDATPSLYLIVNGARRTIVSTTPIYTHGTDPGLFADNRGMLVALARLAADLRRGEISLPEELKVAIQKDTPEPEPLRTRRPTGRVEPEGAAALARWGEFNGSSVELGEPLKSGSVELDSDAKLPRMLGPGASVKLAVKAAGETGQPAYLRIRGAYAKTGAALKAGFGETVVFNESFRYLTDKDAGAYTNVPAEFTRIAFLPEWSGQSIRIENTGTEPIYFDAVQIEMRTKPARDMIVGLGDGYHPAALRPELAKNWGPVRTSVRINLLGPPDAANRWKQVDEKVETALRLNGRVQLIAEGTPAWAPISAERYDEATRAKRAHTCPPDTAKFVEAISELARRYQGKVELWEIWNEADIQQFWRGTPVEYLEFFRAVAPALRNIDPRARVVSGGMAGYSGRFLDSIIDANFMEAADLFGFHPYCFETPAWDVPLGQVEGHLFSRGVGTEIFSDESGFPYKNSEWFQPPPQYTPEVQKSMLSIALARALSNGLAKISVFHAGGDDHPYGLIDDKGQPRAAYEIYSDYALLGARGGRRLDVSTAHRDGKPIEGVYVAAATHDDGGVTLVLNPAENVELLPPPNPSSEFDSIAGWTVFFGKAKAGNGTVEIIPDAGKDYAGFYTQAVLDGKKSPQIEVSVPECEGSWDLVLKLPDKRTISLAKDHGAGVFRANLAEIAPDLKRQDIEISFRVRGRTVIDHVRFLGGEDTPVASLPIRLCLPLPSAGPYDAELREGDRKQSLSVTVKASPGGSMAELDLDLRQLSVLTLTPKHNPKATP